MTSLHPVPDREVLRCCFGSFFRPANPSVCSQLGMTGSSRGRLHRLRVSRCREVGTLVTQVVRVEIGPGLQGVRGASTHDSRGPWLTETAMAGRRWRR